MRFLSKCTGVSPYLDSWFHKKSSPEKSLESPVRFESQHVSDLLGRIHNDAGGVIDDLGYYLTLWNGEEGAHFTEAKIAIGGTAPRTPNYFRLMFRGENFLIPQQARGLCDIVIEVFEPAELVATSDEILDRQGAVGPCEYGWLIYKENKGFQEFPEYKDELFDA